MSNVIAIHEITDDTPIAMLTVGQLREFLQSLTPVPAEQEKKHEYVKGVVGIERLFGVSHTTAQRYKDGFLRPAVTQRGRTIYTDVELARELFNNQRA